MRIEQAEQKITGAGGDIKVFWDWMTGQTCGIGEDGYVEVYDRDVNRFIQYKCDPKNEPLVDFD